MSRATGLFPSVKAEPAAQSVCAPFSTSDDDDACLSFSRGRQFPREEEATAQTGSGSARPSRAPLWTRLFSRAVGGFSAQAAPGTLRLRLGLCLPRLPSKLGFAPSSPETSLLERPSALAGDLRREALASAPVEASSSPSEKSLSHRLSKSSDAERPNKGALSLAPQRRRPKELVVPLRGAADPVVSGQLSAETSRGEEDCCHSSPSLFGRKEKALVGVRHPKARVPLRAQGSRCLECCVQSIPRLCRLPRAAEGAAARLARDWAAEDSERWAAARDRALKWAEAESGGAVMQLLGDLQVLARELLGIARWAATRAFQERLAAAPEGRPNSEGDNKALFADASSRLCRDAQKATARASLLAASLSGGQQHRLRPNAGFARRGFLGVTTQRRVSLWLRAEDATNGVLNSEAERLMRWSLLFQAQRTDSLRCAPLLSPPPEGAGAAGTCVCVCWHCLAAEKELPGGFVALVPSSASSKGGAFGDAPPRGWRGGVQALRLRLVESRIEELLQGLALQAALASAPPGVAEEGMRGRAQGRERGAGDAGTRVALCGGFNPRLRAAWALLNFVQNQATLEHAVPRIQVLEEALERLLDLSQHATQRD